MPNQTIIVAPGPNAHSVRTPDGAVVAVPVGWELLPPGDAVTQHATPVGSGTVARTQRIPIEQRAESAVIAWMRHQTTAYDQMKIPRADGKRREVRRMLAEKTRKLLLRYRGGTAIDPKTCPLRQALGE